MTTRAIQIERSSQIYYKGLTRKVSMVSKVRTEEEKRSGNNFTTKYNILTKNEKR